MSMGITRPFLSPNCVCYEKYFNLNSVTSELSLLFLPKQVVPKAFCFLYGAFQNGVLPVKSNRKITCRKTAFRPIN